jgi:hypothetical protein
MKTALFVGALSTAALLGGAAAWRAADHRTDRSEARRLAEFQPADPGRFDASRVADLPEPARRYFAFAIAPDTPLWTVTEISMTGHRPRRQGRAGVNGDDGGADAGRAARLRLEHAGLRLRQRPVTRF